MNLEAIERALAIHDSAGAGPIQLLAEDDFYDEDSLPFQLGEGGSVLHVFPDPGFRKSNLAGSPDEERVIVDHDDGWLVPADIVSDWLNRHVDCPALEDLVLANPLYEYLTQLDSGGLSRGGSRGQLIQWAPGIPNLASIYAPEYLPDDMDAPRINRDRDAYAAGVRQLLHQLEQSFDVVEIELGIRLAPHQAP